MRVVGGKVVTVTGVDSVADTDEERAFFDRCDAYSRRAERVDVPRQGGSVLGAGSLLSLRAFQPGVDTPRFRRLLDTLTETEATQGNHVQMLFDGANATPDRQRTIAAAKHSILVQTYVFGSDAASWELAADLAAKAEEGVRVCVLYDALLGGDPEIYAFMKRHGVDVREYAPKHEVWNLNRRWHKKMWIIDGEVGYTGGQNVGDHYALGGTGIKVETRSKRPFADEGWRDADIRCEGPVVRQMVLDFLTNWGQLGPGFSEEDILDICSRAGEARPGGVEARFIVQDPVPHMKDRINDAYLAAVGHAEESISIENAYFCPQPALLQALCDAARRGVKVRVLTNSLASCNHPLVAIIMRSVYDDMVAAGVQIFEKQGGTLHAKTATVDGEFSIVGSYNLNARSTKLDTECVLAVHDAETARVLEERFDAGAAEAHRVTSEELNDEGPLVNVLQWTLAVLFGWAT